MFRLKKTPRAFSAFVPLMIAIFTVVNKIKIYQIAGLFREEDERQEHSLHFQNIYLNQIRNFQVIKQDYVTFVVKH
jgi:hypothetical protein